MHIIKHNRKSCYHQFNTVKLLGCKGCENSFYQNLFQNGDKNILNLHLHFPNIRTFSQGNLMSFRLSIAFGFYTFSEKYTRAASQRSDPQACV